MSMLDKLQEPELLGGLGRRLAALESSRLMTVMEVCGTHTMAIHRAGLRTLLPKQMRLVSGPGCPVCVTATDYLDTAMAMAREHGVVVVTFGDMMRIPGMTGTLTDLRGQGYPVEVVYSPLAALEMARQRPDRPIVFLAVGFETTAPTIAATILQAHEERVRNFTVLSAHKVIPPALTALAADQELAIDGFLLPGHVSVVLGQQPYRFLAEQYDRACVIAGFEPADILQGLLMLAAQIREQTFRVEIQYRRTVRPDGNLRARRLINDVFVPVQAEWRGFGTIPDSGLALREAYADLDAAKRFPVSIAPSAEPKGCRCGDVVRGLIEPPDCPLFATSCSPSHPIGACMVSSEGSCAAFYKYSRVR